MQSAAAKFEETNPSVRHTVPIRAPLSGNSHQEKNRRSLPSHRRRGLARRGTALGKLLCLRRKRAGGTILSKVDSRTPNDPLNFTYSANDRLVQVTKGPTGSATILGQFDYNHDGNRIRHRYSDRGDIDYFYDDGAVLEERNASDDSLLAYYVYADRLVSLVQPLGNQYYHHDALGSTIGLTDSFGNDKKSYHLDPWGNIRWETGTSDNRHIFTGKEHDKNTGLVYFGARFYDPEVGRFITQDTYLGEENTPPSLHRYLYAHSNPTVYVDQEGLFAMAGMAGVALEQYYSQWSGWGQQSGDLWTSSGQPLIKGPSGGEVYIPKHAPMAEIHDRDTTVESPNGQLNETMAETMERAKRRWRAEEQAWREEEPSPSAVSKAEMMQSFGDTKEQHESKLMAKGIVPPGVRCEGGLCDIGLMKKAAAALKPPEDWYNPFSWIARWGELGQITFSEEYAKHIPPSLHTKIQAEWFKETYEVGTIATFLYGGLSGLRPGEFARKLRPKAKPYTRPSIEPKLGAPTRTRLRDPKTGRFVSDPANPPSQYKFTDAQRRAEWKRLAEDPKSPLTELQRKQIRERGWRGPQRINQKTGEVETMELSHEPVPLREGGKEVVPRWPGEHAAVDPHRYLKK